MKAARSIVRKATKARARRKDYVRRRNINSNVPTVDNVVKIEKYKQVRGVDGKVSFMAGTGQPKLRHVGYKQRVEKKKVYLRHEKGNPHEPMKDKDLRIEGMIQYPKSKKFHAKKINKNKK